MWLLKKLENYLDYLNEETDEETEAFIDREYYKAVRISGLYPYLGKTSSNVVFLLQIILILIIILGITAFHLLKLSILLFDIEFVLFSQCVHYLIYIITSVTVFFGSNLERRAVSRVHKTIAYGFYLYEDETLIDEIRAKTLVAMAPERRKLILIFVSFTVPLCIIIVLSKSIDYRYGSYDFERISHLVDLRLPILAIFPFSTQSNVGFLIGFIIEMVVAIFILLCIGTAYFIYVVTMQNLSAQLDILIFAFKYLTERTKKMYLLKYGILGEWQTEHECFQNTEFAECYRICLNRCIDHYVVILRVHSDIKKAFSIPLLGCVIGGTFVIVMSLIILNFGSQVHPGTTATTSLLCMCEIVFIGVICVLGQRLINKSSSLRYTIYSIPWYHARKSIGVSVIILQCVTLKPLTITAGGFLTIDLEIFASMMNSAYSYFNVIKAKKNK